MGVMHDSQQAEIERLRERVAELEAELDRTRSNCRGAAKLSQPLHDLIHSRRDWLIEALGRDVTLWAVGKIQELEAENERLRDAVRDAVGYYECCASCSLSVVREKLKAALKEAKTDADD